MHLAAPAECQWHRWAFSRHGQEFTIDLPVALTLVNTALMSEAAADRLEIADVPEMYARAALDCRRLVTALDEWCQVIPGPFLYFRGNHHIAAAVGIDCLIEGVERGHIRASLTAAPHL